MKIILTNLQINGPSQLADNLGCLFFLCWLIFTRQGLADRLPFLQFFIEMVMRRILSFV